MIYKWHRIVWVWFSIALPLYPPLLLADTPPIFQAKQLLAHAERHGNLGGFSVSIDGDTAAVGSPSRGLEGSSPASIGDGFENVFIFERNRHYTNEWGFVTRVNTNFITTVPRGFGYSVSLSGDRLAIGAPGKRMSGESGELDMTYTGKVYICERDAGGTDHWGVVQVLTLPAGGQNRDGFGTSVSLDHTNLVVGAVEVPDPGPVIGGSLASAAAMYERSAGSWSFTTFLVGTPRSIDDRFGTSVAMDGHTAVVGSPRDSNATERVGAAYVFERNQGGAGNWGQVAVLQPLDLDLSDEFGHAVSVAGSNIVVGAQRQDQPATTSALDGAAYLFRRMPGPAWSQIKKFISPDPARMGQYGSSVFIHADRMVVGEPSGYSLSPTPPGYDLEGRAFLYERHQGGADQWGLVRQIRPPNDGTANLFGFSVSIDGNAFLAGDPGNDKSGAGMYAGSAFVFEKNGGGADQWGPVSRLIPTEYDSNTLFGSSAAVDGDTIAIGMPFKDVLNSATDNGQVYIFERNWGGAEEWGLTVSLYGDSPFNPPHGEQFGSAVSLDANTLAVGAPQYEGTNAMILGSGAVYVYDRFKNGTNQWGPIIRLTPNDPGTNNNYGAAVALRGNVLVVGAPRKDTAGINAGSIYIHYRDHLGISNSWSQIGERQAVPPVAFAQFGSSLAMDAQTNLIVGAPFDNTAAAIAGAAYILPNTGGQIRLPAVALPATSFFGQSVDMDGEWAVVGAYGDPDNGSLAGAAYLFRRNQGGPGHWGQFKKIKPSDGTANQFFGWTVALDGERLVVSARGDHSATNGAGALYTFSRNTGGSNNWGQVQKLTVNRPTTNASLGFALDLSGNTLVAGAETESIDGSFQGGAAYVFDELLVHIRSYELAPNGAHEFGITVTPNQPYRFQRSTNNLASWSYYGSGFTPTHKYETRTLPPPGEKVGMFRLQYNP